MNLRDMEYLVAVADLGNFSRAAEQCHVSQPTLSGQIKKLEGYLGVTLFERGGKQAMLTDAGVQIVESAKRMLRESCHIREIAANAGDPLSGSYRLGAFSTLAPYLFPKIIPCVRAEAPSLRLMLFEDKTDLLIEQLLRGDIDAAILALPVHEPQFISQELFTDIFMLAVPADHCLAKRTFVTQKELHAHKLLLLNEGHCLRDQVLDICRAFGVNEDDEYRATGLETLRQTVIAGTGITLMPAIAALPVTSIVYIPFEDPVPQRRIAILRRKSSRRKEVHQVIADICARVTI